MSDLCHGPPLTSHRHSDVLHSRKDGNQATVVLDSLLGPAGLRVCSAPSLTRELDLVDPERHRT